MGGTPNAIH